MMYQRKVRMSLTRAQAQLVQDVLLKAAAHPDNLAALGIEPTKTMMSRAKRTWDIAVRAIERRDTQMRIKQSIKESDQSQLVVGDVDVPLEGL